MPPRSVSSTPVITIRIAISILGLLLAVLSVGLTVETIKSPEWSIRDPSTDALKPLVLIIPLALIVIPSVFALYMTYRRRLWALVLVIAVVGCDMTFNICSTFKQGIAFGLASYLALGFCAAQLAALLLLLAPRSLAWFKGR